MRAAALVVGAAAVLAAGCASGSSERKGTLAQVWSPAAALTFGLRDMCLAAAAARRPVAEFAEKGSASSGVTVGRVRTWYVGSGTRVVDLAGSSCHVQVRDGEPTALRRVATALIADNGGFEQVRDEPRGYGDDPPSERVTTFCSREDESPLRVTLITPVQGRDPLGPDLSVVVSREASGPEARCHPHGQGARSDRNLTDG